jgi:phosphatidylethanolamine/phosphatidyl-N-methylethanolamine N-methyltransferase
MEQSLVSKPTSAHVLGRLAMMLPIKLGIKLGQVKIVGNIAERARFFAKWLRRPFAIGAIAPSSRRLADAMAANLPTLTPQDWVVELGGGTGVFTAALLRHHVPANRLMVVERDKGLAKTLRKKFPKVLVVQGDATQLPKLAAQHGVSQVAAVVSGLPLIGMPKPIQARILAGAFKLLPIGKPFIQFTYAVLPPVAYRRLGLNGACTKVVWRNIPPASVWRFSKQPKIL